MCYDKNHRIVVSYNPLKFQAANLKNGDFMGVRSSTALVSYKNRYTQDIDTTCTELVADL